MTPDDFAALADAELRPLAVPFGRRDLQAFVAAAWPLVLEDPDPSRSGRAFLEATATAR
jgi:hypothetical protein